MERKLLRSALYIIAAACVMIVNGGCGNGRIQQDDENKDVMAALKAGRLVPIRLDRKDILLINNLILAEKDRLGRERQDVFLKGDMARLSEIDQRTADLIALLTNVSISLR